MRVDEVGRVREMRERLFAGAKQAVEGGLGGGGRRSVVKMEDGEVAVRGVGRGEDVVLKAVEALGRRKEELARAREETVARLAGMEEGVTEGQAGVGGVREGKQERRASWVVEWDGNPEDIHDDEERKAYMMRLDEERRIGHEEVAWAEDYERAVELVGRVIREGVQCIPREQWEGCRIDVEWLRECGGVDFRRDGRLQGPVGKLEWKLREGAVWDEGDSEEGGTEEGGGCSRRWGKEGSRQRWRCMQRRWRSMRVRRRMVPWWGCRSSMSVRRGRRLGSR